MRTGLADPLWGLVSIGTEIARAREAAGLTHADLAHRTRIRSGILQAIERDDFDACGGTVYARGHIRAVAVALGVDPKPWLDDLGGIDAPTHLAQEEPQRLDIWELRERSKASGQRRTWTVLIAAAVVMIGVFVVVASNNTAEPELVPSDTPSATATPSVSESPSAMPTSADMATPGATPIDTNQPITNAAVTLQLDCSSSSWVRLTNDVGTLYEGTLRSGDSKTVTSDTAITVRIGNAAGITVTYNGAVQPSLGGPGQVYTNTFGAQ